MLLQTIGMLAAAVVAAWVAVRGASAYRGARRSQRGVVIACVIVAVIGATVAVYAARGVVMCPAGYGEPDAERSRTRSGKGGMKVVCTSADGESRDGSVFAGVFAWIALVALGLAGGALVLRAVGGQPVVVVPPPPPTPSGPPTDKKDRRRQRKARARG